MSEVNECKCCREPFVASSTREEYCRECELVKQELMANKRKEVLKEYEKFCTTGVHVSLAYNGCC